MRLFGGILRSDPSSEILDRQRAHALRVARNLLLELDRAELMFGRFGVVQHEDDHYKVIRGEVADPKFSPAAAFYVSESGEAVYLERVR